jgi:hypothetical protein
MTAKKNIRNLCEKHFCTSGITTFAAVARVNIPHVKESTCRPN